MVIDVHAHLGCDRVYDDVFTVEQQLDKMTNFNIDVTIIQPALVHTLEEVYQQHNDIAELTSQYRGRFLGMANPNPHLRASDYEQEIRRCILELGFVGIKIHTAAHGVDPGSLDGQRVFALARELKVPVMVHTGAGIPFANPAAVIPVAEQFSDVPIVLAHSGMMIMAAETLVVMKRCSNVYADITWTPGFLLRHWINEIGAHRFMFGTDHADNCETELSKVRSSGLTGEQQEWVLNKSAIDVYKLTQG